MNQPIVKVILEGFRSEISYAVMNRQNELSGMINEQLERALTPEHVEAIIAQECEHVVKAIIQQTIRDWSYHRIQKISESKEIKRKMVKAFNKEMGLP